MGEPDKPMPTLAFEHTHAAHCESGAICAMLRHRGLRLSEPMVFGIGAGLFFLYLPLLKIYGAPLVAYRDAPNSIMNRCARQLGVRLNKARFRSEDDAMAALDAALARGQPAGMQTGVFWLPYFPRDMRFQFNGHHVVAYGKEHDDYLLSDTVFEEPVRCAQADLRRARFSKGPLAPRGFLYTIEHIDPDPDLPAAVRAGLRTTCSRMLDIPIPWLGCRGIRRLGHGMAQWPRRQGEARARSWLANVIRMQEEIGTGGAGFRFMYAAFLEEASALLGIAPLLDLSDQLSQTGDHWRDFAVAGAAAIRDKSVSPAACEMLGDMLVDCADRETRIFRAIRSCLREPR